MNQELFIERGEKRWRGFEDLLKAVEVDKKPGGRAFPRLYRAVCHDLALARQRQFDAHLVDRLNVALGAGPRLRLSLPSWCR